MMVKIFYIGFDTMTSNMTASSAYSTVLCACQKNCHFVKRAQKKTKRINNAETICRNHNQSQKDQRDPEDRTKLTNTF